MCNIFDGTHSGCMDKGSRMSSGIRECPKCHALLDDGVEECDQCGVKSEVAHTAELSTPLISNKPVNASRASLMASMSRSEPSKASDLIIAVLVAIVVAIVLVALYRVSGALFYLALVLIGPSSIAGYYVGKKSGNTIAGLVWGSLLGPMGVVVAWALPDKNREPCPYCAEQILSSARLCPHCRSDV